MIVKNEEMFLHRCLKSVRSFVDEIIVVDTGSTDRTIDIAEQFGAKVFEHAWEYNFAKHRNQSISYATGDWILILDADEELLPNGGDILKKAVRVQNMDSIAVQIINPKNKSRDIAVFNSVRVFRQNAGIRYEGTVHNREVGCKSTKFYPIQILHHGYDIDGEKKREKFDRTTSLLKKQIEDNPSDPLPHHYLSVSYMSMGCLDSVYYNKAIEEAMRAIELAELRVEDDPAYLGTHYVAAASFLNLGNLDHCAQICERALKICPEHLDSCFLLMKLYDKTGQVIQARQYAEQYIQIRKAIKTSPERFGKIINNNFNGDCFALLVIGKAKYEEGLKDEAQSFFRQARERVPDNHNVSALIGDYYFKKAEYELAVSFLRDFCNHQKEKLILYMLCECYARLGEVDRQIGVLSQIINYYPEEAEIFLQIGMVQLEKYQFAVAKFCLEAAVDRGVASCEILQHLETGQAASAR